MDMVRRKQSERKNTWNIYKSRRFQDHRLTCPPRSVVISVFAIIILSTLGAMFAAGNHTVMGSAEDPKDGKQVATAVFGAVIIYGVSVALWELEARADPS